MLANIIYSSFWRSHALNPNIFEKCIAHQFKISVHCCDIDFVHRQAIVISELSTNIRYYIKWLQLIGAANSFSKFISVHPVGNREIYFVRSDKSSYNLGKYMLLISFLKRKNVPVTKMWKDIISQERLAKSRVF